MRAIRRISRLRCAYVSYLLYRENCDFRAALWCSYFPVALEYHDARGVGFAADSILGGVSFVAHSCLPNLRRLHQVQLALDSLRPTRPPGKRPVNRGKDACALYEIRVICG